MKTFRSKRGPFTEQPYFTDEELELLCLDELAKYDLLPAVERSVEKRFNVTVESADLEDGLLGLTRFGRDGVQRIYVSQTLEADNTVWSERLLRSTIGAKEDCLGISGASDAFAERPHEAPIVQWGR